MTRAGFFTPSGRFWSLLFVAFAVASVYPLWNVRYAPIQDLPQHLAAIRVLFDYSDPGYGFERFFERDPWRTQYLAYYGVVGLLSRALDLELSNRVVLSAAMIGTPYALRSLLGVLGRDPRLALLAFGLVYNAHLVLGFLNFVAAIPLALWGIALAVRDRRDPRRARAVGIALLALVCFYTHVVPFAFLALGLALVGVGRDWRASALRLAPLGPALLGALAWAVTSPAGQATRGALGGVGSGREPEFAPWRQALDEAPMWLTDVLGTDWDLRLLYAWLALGGLALLAAPFLGVRLPAPDALARSIGRRLVVLPLAAAALYFVAPTSYDWIWPIAQRFPLLALLFVIPVLPRPGRVGGHVLALAAAVVASAHLHFAATAFAHFEHEELGDFEEALAEIPPAERVVGLVFERGSRHVRFSPFLHYVAYYQARKGGAVMFSFADFAHSPVRFGETNRPPRVPPRWEWLPALVDPARELDWYDWVLVRGGPGRIAQARETWSPTWRGRKWSVWRRVR